MSAYIFLCNNRTESECLDRKLFGTTKKNHYIYDNLNIGDTLFLYNYDMHYLVGPFRAITNCRPKIIPEAFNGRYNFHVLVEESQNKHIKIFKDKFMFLFDNNNILRTKISDTECQTLLEIMNAEFMKFFIFKCNNETGVIIYLNNIMGATAELFKKVKNNVQIGHKVFLFNYESCDLYGLWKVNGPIRFQKGVFQIQNKDYPTIVPVERIINYENGINENRFRHLLNIHGNIPFSLNNNQALLLLNELVCKNTL